MIASKPSYRASHPLRPLTTPYGKSPSTGNTPRNLPLLSEHHLAPWQGALLRKPKHSPNT
jgi:hypothetical protein